MFRYVTGLGDDKAGMFPLFEVKFMKGRDVHELVQEEVRYENYMRCRELLKAYCECQKFVRVKV